MANGHGGARVNAGRPKGSTEQGIKLLREAILIAAENAGGEADETTPGGVVGYLQKRALDQPVAFMSLLGKVLPTQVEGNPDAPIVAEIRMVPVSKSE